MNLFKISKKIFVVQGEASYMTMASLNLISSEMIPESPVLEAKAKFVKIIIYCTKQVD